jgi:hypothetical protein
MLWTQLILICFIQPIAAAIASAKHAKAGPGGFAAVIRLGLALGLFGAWAMWAGGEALGARIERQPESLQERYFCALFFAAIVWIIITAELGAWLSSTMLRLVADHSAMNPTLTSSAIGEGLRRA